MHVNENPQQRRAMRTYCPNHAMHCTSCAIRSISIRASTMEVRGAFLNISIICCICLSIRVDKAPQVQLALCLQIPYFSLWASEVVSNIRWDISCCGSGLPKAVALGHSITIGGPFVGSVISCVEDVRRDIRLRVSNRT